MSKLVVARYFVKEIFKIPENIDLEDKTVVKGYGVKWNKLYIDFVDGTEKEIKGENWVDSYDFKYPDAKLEIVDRERYGVDYDDSEDDEEEDSDDEEAEDEEPKDEKVKVYVVERNINGMKYYVCKNTGNVYDPITKELIGTYNQEKNIVNKLDDEEDSDDEDDILRCERCGYEDIKNEDGVWEIVLTNPKDDKCYCRECDEEEVIKKKCCDCQEDFIINEILMIKKETDTWRCVHCAVKSLLKEKPHLMDESDETEILEYLNGKYPYIKEEEYEPYIEDV